jgi:hypothetical protein
MIQRSSVPPVFCVSGRPWMSLGSPPNEQSLKRPPMTRGLPVFIQSSLVDILDWVMGVERSWGCGLVHLQLLKDDRVGGGALSSRLL